MEGIWTLEKRARAPPPPPLDPEPNPTPTLYSITIGVQGSGTINPTPGKYSYEKGAKINITQTPSLYWKFTHWLIDNTTHTENTLNMTLTKNLNIIAVFAETPPDCGINFKVTDINQNPIAGAIIETSLRMNSNQNINLVLETNGIGSLNFIRYGNYTLKATKQGYESKSWNVTIAAGEHVEYNITLETLPVDIQLTLLALDGVPLKEVLIMFLNGPSGQSIVSGVTDSKGTLIFKGIKPGGYKFEIKGTWIKKQVWPIYIKISNTPQSFNTSLQCYSGLKLRVVNNQGNPVSGVIVQSSKVPTGQGSLNVICNGNLTITDLLDGFYTLRFSKEGYYNVDNEVQLKAGTINEAGTVVMVKTWTTILSENIILIFASLALVGVAGYAVFKRVSPSTSNELVPTRLAVPIILKSVPVPIYFGTTEGAKIKAITIDGLNDYSEIKHVVGVSDDVFMKSIYALLRSDVLIGSDKGVFDVNVKIRREWVSFFKQ